MPPTPTEHAHWFAKEVQPHESRLRWWLRGLFPSLPDMDDLIQESYLRLIRAKEAGKVGHARAYLFTTARNALNTNSSQLRATLSSQPRLFVWSNTLSF